MLAGRQVLWVNLELGRGDRSSFSLFSIFSNALGVGDGGNGVFSAVIDIGDVIWDSVSSSTDSLRCCILECLRGN